MFHFDFINDPNFECSPEKFDYIINILSKKYIEDPNEKYKEKINTISNILIRKTKEEDYKIIKECIKKMDISTDIELLNKKEKTLLKF